MWTALVRLIHDQGKTPYGAALAGGLKKATLYKVLQTGRVQRDTMRRLARALDMELWELEYHLYRLERDRGERNPPLADKGSSVNTANSGKAANSRGASRRR